MKGWRYEWVDELPQDVYETLVLMLYREAQPADDPFAALAQLEPV